ncbi:MAG: hypothetical protein ACTHN5_12475 [Phycisphaerae bacterium]
MNDRLALQLVDHRTLDCVTFATMNLPEFDLKPGEVFIKDHDDHEELARLLFEAKVIEGHVVGEGMLWGTRRKLAIDIPEDFEEGMILCRPPSKEYERNRGPYFTP